MWLMYFILMGLVNIFAVLVICTFCIYLIEYMGIDVKETIFVEKLKEYILIEAKK